jgi:hypothetical protein
MLFVLIPIAIGWLAITAFVLALCHMAARSDSQRRLAERRLRETPAPVARDRRASASRWRPAIHGIR